MGVLVHFVPLELHDLVQEHLEQAMPPNGARGDALAGRGQRGPFVGRELNQLAVGQALEHDAGTRGRNAEAFGNVGGVRHIAAHRQAVDYVQIMQGGIVYTYGVYVFVHRHQTLLTKPHRFLNPRG